MKIFKNATIILLVVGSLTVKAQNIQMSACQGKIKRLDSLLNAKQDINSKDNHGRTALHYSIRCRKPKVLNFLLEKGADVNASTHNGETPLLIARQVGDMEAVRILLDKNAVVNVTDKQGQSTVFHPVRSGNREREMLLIRERENANVNQANNSGISSLHNAVLGNNLEFVKLLVNDHSNIDTVNANGNTALGIAFRDGFDEIADFLIEKGADKSKARTQKPKGKYLGQSEPGLQPEIFGPNFISTERGEHTITFYPNGKELYYTVEGMGGAVIMTTKLIKGKWSTPQPANIPGEYREIDPFITLDGSKLLYCSDRPVNENDSAPNVDLWMQPREGDQWGAPQHLGHEVNTDGSDWFPTISKKETLYFSAGTPDNICYSELVDGVYQKPVFLGDSINSKHTDFDPFIAPDESYLIFTSSRPGGFGSDDLYISFRDEEGLWTKAKNMGETINSSSIDFTPGLSPDGKYFFFSSGRAGSSDIYWVDSQVIENLR